MTNIPKYSILKISIYREFVESSIFRKQIDCMELGLLRRVQYEILKNPESGDVITGTGGVRKIRVGKSNIGKSGGYRVLYLDLPNKNICHLLLIFNKNEMSNISSEEKKVIRGLVEKIKIEGKSEKV